MSPYAATYADLAPAETAVLAELERHPGCSMRDLLSALTAFSSVAVKGAVWHLIDKGTIRIEPDRTMVRAA